MIPAYIAGPFAGDVARNTARACALSRWAVANGYAPVCVHPGVVAGAYGDDNDPAERERGLAVCVALVGLVARRFGVMLVILRDDGTPSSGTAREVEAWRNWRFDNDLTMRTWAEWVAAGVTDPEIAAVLADTTPPPDRFEVAP